MENMENQIRELTQKEEHFKHALAMVRLGYWYWNPSTNELIWSDECYKLLGLDPASGIAPSMEIYFNAIHAEDIPKVQANVQNVMVTGHAPDMEYRLIQPTGETITVATRAELVRNPDGSPKFLFGTLQDVTEQKEQQEKVEHAMRAAEAANKAKSAFLSSMSHELRTPLNAVIGFAHILEMEQLEDSQLDSVQEIIKAGTHLLSLVGDVLDLSAIDSGKIELSIEQVEVGIVMEECVNLLNPLARQNQIKLHIAIENDTLYANTDRVRLKQSLLNLMSNAIKYNKPGGQVHVTAKLVNDQVVLSVIDNGTGVPENKKHLLFVPFERLGHESGTVEGTGIGLTITQRLMKALGGTVEYAPEETGGSRFSLTLPGGLTSDTANIINFSEALAKKKMNDCSLSILYIDDNPSNLKLMQLIVAKRGGATIELANTPRLGLDLALHNHFDLIFVDISMPEMDGYEVLQRLKQWPSTQNTPLFAITANAGATNISKGLAAGFTRYFTKPINAKEILETIDKYTAQKQSVGA